MRDQTDPKRDGEGDGLLLLAMAATAIVFAGWVMFAAGCLSNSWSAIQ